MVLVYSRFRKNPKECSVGSCFFFSFFSIFLGVCLLGNENVKGSGFMGLRVSECVLFIENGNFGIETIEIRLCMKL